MKKINSKTNTILPLIIIFLAVFIYEPVSGLANEAEIIPVSSGTSITVYEQTGGIYECTYPVAFLLAGREEFVTNAGEKYTISSDGTYLTVHCFHNKSVLDEGIEYFPVPKSASLPFAVEMVGASSGNNIVGVRLDGVPGYSDGLWASFIVSYYLGNNSIPDSRMNALGNASISGDHKLRYCTSLGRGHSEIVYGFSSLLNATINLARGSIVPEIDMLIATIELPEEHEAGDIDFATVMISEANDTDVSILPLSWSMEIGDWNTNDISDMSVGFANVDLKDYLNPGNNALTIAGRLYDGIPFTGTGSVKIE